MSKSDRDKKCQRAEIGLIAEIARPQSGGPLALPMVRAARVVQPPHCVQHLSIERCRIERASVRNWLSGLQLIEQRLRVLQIARVEAFSEPAVHRSKNGPQPASLDLTGAPAHLKM
jgi:hypothetical protein